jgi:hypothetical protein
VPPGCGRGGGGGKSTASRYYPCPSQRGALVQHTQKKGEGREAAFSRIAPSMTADGSAWRWREARKPQAGSAPALPGEERSPSSGGHAQHT